LSKKQDYSIQNIVKRDTTNTSTAFVTAVFDVCDDAMSRWILEVVLV